MPRQKVDLPNKFPTEYDYELFDRKRSELLTTLTELNAIAAAANVGLRKPRAASGIPMIL
jgi:hypothetical protein